MTAKPATVSELHEKAAATAAEQPTLHQHASLATALVAALAELTVVEKGRTVTVAHKGGGQHSYDYADIADVVKLTRPVLSNHGIVALTPVHDHGDGLACTVTLLHTSGERLDLGPFPFPRGHDAQATGSMVTYHRRYALIAALGMAAGDDDDGAAASRPAPRREPDFVWNANVVKQRLVELLGDKTKAAEAWTNGHGDDLTEWSAAAADRLAQEWRDNQPADESGEPTLPLEGET